MRYKITNGKNTFILDSTIIPNFSSIEEECAKRVEFYGENPVVEIIEDEAATQYRLIRQKVTEAFEQAWNYINEYIDQGGLIQLLNWKFEYADNTTIVSMIKAIEDWKDLVMYRYLMVYKPAILGGDDPVIDYSDISYPVTSFTDVFLATQSV